jgi:hypothetical protein
LLPDELLDIIALELKFAKKKRSLANLGMCSKRLRNVTDEVLWKEVDWKEDIWPIPAHKRPAGWKFTE